MTQGARPHLYKPPDEPTALLPFHRDQRDGLRAHRSQSQTPCFLNGCPTSWKRVSPDHNAPEFRRMGTRLWAHPDDSNPHCSVHLPLPCAGNSQQKWAVEELKKNKTGRTQLNNRVCWTHGGRGHFSTPPRGIFQLNFTFRMTREGIDFEAMLTPWLRLCIGVAVLFVAATPLVYAIAALVRASHQ